uniref:Uncharacterized protein n=1 Tax=Avena sativa TaxID=4498 RepID=A0ACD5X4G7_AVESA
MAPHAARLVLLLAVAATHAGRSEAGWCICRQDLPDPTLQKTLDYACGGGADCRPILQNGACFAPNNVKAHCSYAVNSYYQRNGQNPQACVFAGTATVSANDPSNNGCIYPATQSAAGSSGAGGGTIGGVDSPPALGPSSFNDSSSATSIFPEAAAGTAKRAAILACFSLLALYLGA